MRPGPTALGPFDPGFEELPVSIPLFPLTDALLLPGGRLPLNIFEPRYLAMIRYALTQPTRLIGLVQPVEAGADRKRDLDHVPHLKQVGCAGRIVSFEETSDGRYSIALSGLVRFRLERELPRHVDGFRQAMVDFNPYVEDMAERGFTLTDREHFLRLLKSFLEMRQLGADQEAISQAQDDQLLVSLAMLCPFSPAEKQSLLECGDLDTLADMMTALFEISIAAHQQPDRPLH
ncbi:MAG TPA: LON peptidase substrate-binding domain-containing protein [Terriglobales bacterium]|nr:LON peptidase substrate-binding domain-containing protein [Terriglobales bacterium]